MNEGIILLGHGSRRVEANQEILDMAEKIKQRNPEGMHETAFLSFGEPDVVTAAKRLIKKGATKIIVVPLFLVTGNHIKRDIPSRLVMLKTTYPDVVFVLSKHIGPHDGMLAIIEERIKEAQAL